MGEDKKWKILVVDDEKTNLDVLNHILGDHYTVYIAKSGEAALKKAKENRPDLILLDIVMPGMHGFEVISRLKAEEDTRSIPVIFITGLNDAANEEKGIRLGASDYISKPFNPVVILARIKTQLTILEQIRFVERMEMIDPLTNLPNRWHFDVLVQTEWRRALREQTSLALIRIKVPPGSDSAYPDIAGILKTSVARSGGIVVKFEDDDFGVLLSNVSDDDTAYIVGDIRRNIDSIIPEDMDIEIAAVRPDKEASLEDFIVRACKLSPLLRKDDGN